MRVAIQGGQASFHHAAALRYFGETSIDLIECNLFSQVCDALIDGRASRGIMAIENTLAGSILPNYQLLMAYSLHVVGEIHLRIEQNFMALPGQTIDDIRTVRSHPMALLQSSAFLHAHPGMTPVESFDTADSARDIRAGNLRGVGAIAGRLAAELYNLEILAPSVENEHTNYTRFLVLSRDALPSGSLADKATITFSIPHRPGALIEVLQVFHQIGCNLTLIQSVPLAGKPYEYLFCVDFEYGSPSTLQEALRQLREVALETSVIGAYKRGDSVHLT